MAAAFTVSVDGKTVVFTFREVVGRTGTNTPLLWIAKEGRHERGVLIKVADVLVLTLKPQPAAGQLPSYAAQVSPLLLKRDIEAVGVDKFMTTERDHELVLTTQNAPSEWTPPKNPPG